MYEDPRNPVYSPTDKSTSPQSLYNKPWPARPQRLYKGLSGWRWWDSTCDFVMVLIPVPFYLLAIAVGTLNGREIDEHQFEILEQSIKGATTLFPISFAAVIGRGSVKFATWNLEQGTTLGALEQLMGSRTVASAFTTQLQLRSFNWIGLVLLFIWCLSPIGGQSVLHILSTPIKSTMTLNNITYINSRQQSYAAPGGSFKGQWYPGLAVLFGSSLLAPNSIKLSTMDTWGNVKIPYFYDNSSTSISDDGNGWQEVSESNSTRYSSLLGIPISGVSGGNSTFNLESTHLQMACGNLTQTPPTSDAAGQLIKSNFISTAGPYFSYYNVSQFADWAVGYSGLDITSIKLNDTSAWTFPLSCPDCLQTQLFNMTFSPGTFIYEEYSQDNITTSVFCTPSQAYVESAIFCSTDDNIQKCRVTAQRASLLPHMPPEITYLNFPLVASGVTALLPNITGQFQLVNEVQNYIYDPLSQGGILTRTSTITEDEGTSPLPNISMIDIGDRLGQIMNAFLFGSTWSATSYLTGAPFSGMVANPVGGNSASFVPATTADLVAMIQNQTAAFTVPGVQTTQSQIYLCSFPWLGVFLLANTVMLIAAITGVIFSRKTIVPDYLGYVSSLAKESPYIRMPDVGVNMDGMDKARLVKEVKVRLGDVADDEEGANGIGRLAFARMEETKLVQKGKLYV